MIEKKLEELNDSEFLMRDGATEIRQYGRYLKSTTKVGCCIKASNHVGEEIYFSGCNFDMEWGHAIHAEESAITVMVTNSDPSYHVSSCYIYCEREQFTSCGNCRDWLFHFSGQNEKLPVYIDNGKKILIFELGELIPHYPRR